MIQSKKISLFGGTPKNFCILLCEGCYYDILIFKGTDIALMSCLLVAGFLTECLESITSTACSLLLFTVVLPPLIDPCWLFSLVRYSDLNGFLTACAHKWETHSKFGYIL